MRLPLLARPDSGSDTARAKRRPSLTPPRQTPTHDVHSGHAGAPPPSVSLTPPTCSATRLLAGPRACTSCLLPRSASKPHRTAAAAAAEEQLGLRLRQLREWQEEAVEDAVDALAPAVEQLTRLLRPVAHRLLASVLQPASRHATPHIQRLQRAAAMVGRCVQDVAAMALREGYEGARSVDMAHFRDVISQAAAAVASGSGKLTHSLKQLQLAVHSSGLNDADMPPSGPFGHVRTVASDFVLEVLQAAAARVEVRAVLHGLVAQVAEAEKQHTEVCSAARQPLSRL